MIKKIKSKYQTSLVLISFFLIQGCDQFSRFNYESFDWILNPRQASTTINYERVPSRQYYELCPGLGYNDTCVRDDAVSCTVECIVYGLYDSGSL